VSLQTPVFPDKFASRRSQACADSGSCPAPRNLPGLPGQRGRSRRETFKGGVYWDYKPDFRPGEVVEL